VRVFDTYGATECSPIPAECSFWRKHLFEDEALIGESAPLESPPGGLTLGRRAGAEPLGSDYDPEILTGTLRPTGVVLVASGVMKAGHAVLATPSQLSSPPPGPDGTST
jgi:hypothetical protein